MSRLEQYLRQKRAYQLRSSGLSFAVISEKLGYTNRSGSRNAAAAYARRVGLEMPSIDTNAALVTVSTIKRKRAYYLRVRTRLPWVQIAYHCDYESLSGARRAACRYARENDLPPPPRSSLMRGEISYTDRAKGEDWEVIALELDTTAENARHIAWSHAQNLKKPWPPVEGV